MTRIASILGAVLLAAAFAACGGRSTPMPSPPLSTPAVQGQVQQPAAAQQVEPEQEGAAVNRPAQLPEPLQAEEAPPPPWPTFTPGPEPQSSHRLLFARSHRFYTANADGSQVEQLEFSATTPPLLAASYKESGRGWLSPDGHMLLYFAGDEAQLWWGDVQTLDNGMLAERMLPPGQEESNDLIHVLNTQRMAWTSDGSRVAYVGVPNNVDLFVLDVASRSATQITDDGQEEDELVWSPDNTKLVYLSLDAVAGTEDVGVWDAVSQSTTQVDVQPIRDAGGLAPDAHLSFGWQFDWLDDSRLALYPQSGNQSDASLGIWVYDVPTGQLKQIVADSLQSVDWSQAAQAWAYTRTDEPGTVWLARSSGGRPEALAQGNAHAPVWSPEGSELLYSVGDPDVVGWNLAIADLNGNSRVIAENAALIENDLSEPGPNGKRYWGPDGSFVVYTSVGRDYGRAEAQEGYGGQAGPDLENWWIAPLSGGTARMATDLQKVFYLQQPALSPDGTTWAYIGFSYTDRLQHLYAMPVMGGHPEQVDAGVGWFRWLE
jgi:Tol biopolymer transport system component